ncbi:MAG: hypothetical protein OEY93_04615 [Anaerolineae bacterium]|nr:hypothetical protein [Anaerolineae bacterium]
MISSSLRVGYSLPHSSGASRWHQSAENRALIERAIGLITQHYRALFPERTR